MKRTALIFTLLTFLVLGFMTVAIAQEQPKPKKDTVNIDTDAKPTFYYAADDEKSEKKSNSFPIAIVAGVVVVGAGAGFFLLKKKK